MILPSMSVIEQTWNEFYPDRKRFDTMSEEAKQEWYDFFYKYEEIKEREYGNKKSMICCTGNGS